MMGEFEDFIENNKDDYQKFARNMDRKVAKAEENGLESITQHVSLGDMDLFGVGVFYDPDLDDSGNPIPSSNNRRFHVGSTDGVSALKYVEDYIWQRRMKDFAFGVVAFTQQIIKDIESNRTPNDNQILEHVTHLMEDDPDLDPNNKSQVAIFVMDVVMTMMMSDDKMFSMMFKQVVKHEEPQMIALGYPQSIASIIEGATHSDTSDMRHPSNIGKPITDKDIENFIKESMKDKKENEEE